MLTNDYCVCIRAIDFSETSQVLTIFARRTGKVTAIAKGAKRKKSPFGGPVDVFSCGNVTFSDSGTDKLATLVEFEPVTGIIDTSVLARDIFILNSCLFATELVNVLTTDFDPHQGLFDGFLKFLHDVTELEISKDRVLAHLVLFQLCLLREIGLSPVLDHCVNCKIPSSPRWQEAYFSNNARGLLCRDCQGTFPDRIGLTLRIMRYLADMELALSAREPEIRQIEKILISYITDVLGRRPKMAKYILNS